MSSNEIISINKDLKKEELQQELRKKIFEEYNQEFKIGDVISDSYGFWPIEDITEKDGMIYLHYTINGSYTNGKKYTQKKSLSIKDFIYYSSYYKTEASTIQEFEQEVKDLISSDTTIERLVKAKFGTNNDVSDSREVMVQNKDVLKEKKLQLIRQQNFVQARMKRMEEIMESKRRHLYAIQENMLGQIKRLNKLILQLEIYLGLTETVYQFQSGANALDSDPICLRQRVLYMDVECGDPTDNGIDFSNIQDFVDWLLKENPYWKKKNYEILIPESKCVVVFRVRKDDKDYRIDNPFVKSMWNDENKRTYVFIRNGDNIYMIDSELDLGKQLFPSSKELETLVETYSKDSSSYSKKEAEDKVFDYKLNIILIQGLIERTKIFPKEQFEINLFNPSTYTDKTLRFIYDNDQAMQLPSDIETFSNWRKRLNTKIEEGSRVFLISKLIDRPWQRDNIGYYARERFFKRNNYNELNIPKDPNSGIYQIFKEKEPVKRSYYAEESTDCYFIKYNPGGEVNIGWSRYEYDKDYTRKNNISYRIFPDADEFIINYDVIGEVELKTLEFYMYTRIGREDYLSYIPMLMELYKAKKEELEKERMFINLVLKEVGWEDSKINVIKVKKEIVWWKLKNKWKRGLTVDETKALRMIQKRLKSNSKINNHV